MKFDKSAWHGLVRYISFYPSYSSTLNGPSNQIAFYLNVHLLAFEREEALSTPPQHFDATHSRKPNGKFVVPLHKKEDVKPLGESRYQVLKQFLSLERSLHTKHHFDKFSEVIQEYIVLGHAELVPADDLNKPPSKVYY